MTLKEAVKKLQVLINKLNNNNALIVDGLYGPLTEAAYQKAINTINDPVHLEPVKPSGKLWLFGPDGFVNFRQRNGGFIQEIQNGELVNTTGEIIGDYTQAKYNDVSGKVWTEYTIPYEDVPDAVAITLYNGETIMFSELCYGNGYPNTPVPLKYRPSIQKPLKYFNMVMEYYGLTKADIFIRGGYRNWYNNKVRDGAPESYHTERDDGNGVCAIDMDLTKSGLKKTNAYKIADRLEKVGLVGGIKAYNEKSVHGDARGYNARW